MSNSSDIGLIAEPGQPADRANTRSNDATRRDRLAGIAAVARAKVQASGDPLQSAPVAFVRAYYARVPLAEIAETSAENLCTAADAHWRLGRSRPFGSPRVRVYNPRPEVDGWQSPHTVVEVVTDDMPFLVASVTAEISRRELAVSLVVHPVVRVRRDERGQLLALAEDDPEATAESFIHVEITRLADDEHDRLAAALTGVLADVRAAVGDLQPARARLRDIIATLPDAISGLAPEDVAEVRAFLEWLYTTHFTFLGMRAYRVLVEGQTNVVEVEPGSGLGVMRSPEFVVFDNLKHGAPLPPTARAFFLGPDILAVTKADRRSTVSRPVLMDSIIIKRYEDGRVCGFHIITGLFGSAAYIHSARNVPLLRRKIERVLRRAGFAAQSHDNRALINIIETFPRDELFQVSEDQLLAVTLGILDLQQRPRVKLFVRRDEFERFVSCLVYLPRDRYTTKLRLAVQAILTGAYRGELVAQYTQVTDSPHARLQIVLATQPGQVPEVDPADVEKQIVEASRGWSDRLTEALVAAGGEEQGARLQKRYGRAFPPGYQERMSPAEAVRDIDDMERLLASGELAMALEPAASGTPHALRLKLFHPDAPIPLSHVLPLLEAFGLRVMTEVPHAIEVGGDEAPRRILLHDFELESENGRAIDLTATRAAFFDAFLAVWRGDAESDRLNGLVLESGLGWREVGIIRAYARYLRQAGLTFTQRYVERAVVGNFEIAARAVALFRARLDPDGDGKEREARTEALRGEITALLDKVVNADEDRILRRFINLVETTLRTNFFQRDANGRPKAHLALKLDSSRVEDLPLPRPMVEVFVYSPSMEGVHLRGGKVARGGIRWSDRREDFRTEILGLMKAQMVKNAVIVPVGAKGGFVLKQPPDPADREATQAAGIAAYRTLIQGLLDITDNRVAGGIVPPPRVVRVDGDDPYLVVAADKGTATFSDIANGIAQAYGFWLGDAFASGGSQGYDHKQMGITARGAWESVKRHFREMGHDIQTQPFSVVGVGDMSGDVFGNGMLLSPAIRLLAAFDHRHIFVDPSPDPAVSLAERQRLFRLPRSSWADYAPSLLSAGGQVFDRRAKVCVLTPEIRQRFAIAKDRLTPVELIRILLEAEVDLLWFGGIGTYVKASHESHGDVGDRGNDPVRVDADRLRCKVVGEGANLGVTQFARIEFGARGGRINTDFIDNSAGVDCSDHEVNIKILLDAVVAEGGVDGEERNRLLVEMTEEVAGLVLHDNYAQTQAISLIAAEGAAALDSQARLIRSLERQGRLNRTVDVMPDEEALAERGQARLGLTRPEIAVLFSTCKIWLADEILASDLPDDPHLAGDIVRYFPQPMQARFRAAIGTHRLRRELIATMITNSLINRVGGTFITDVAEKTGATPVDIARAYIVARDVFAVRSLWHGIEGLDGKVDWAVQVRLYGTVFRLIERATRWFLRHGSQPLDISVSVAAFDTAVAHLAERLEEVVPDAVRAQIADSTRQETVIGVPADLARRVAMLPLLPAATDLVRMAAATGASLDSVAARYFAIGERFGFAWLRSKAEAIPAPGYWQRLAITAIIDELYEHQRRLTEGVVAGDAGTPADALAAWSARHARAVERSTAVLGELQAAAAVDLSMLAVAGRQLRALAES
ncbi:MAG: NAD-glutamate dehydrogenase [Rhodospirillales bacterium]